MVFAQFYFFTLVVKYLDILVYAFSELAFAVHSHFASLHALHLYEVRKVECDACVA